MRAAGKVPTTVTSSEPSHRWHRQSRKGLRQRATKASAARTLSACATCGATDPQPKAVQRGLAIDARRHRIDQRHGQAPIAQQPGKVQIRADLNRRAHRCPPRSERGNCPAGQPRARFQQPIAVQHIHPVGIGRDEDIGGAPSWIWRASADDPASDTIRSCPVAASNPSSISAMALVRLAAAIHR